MDNLTQEEREQAIDLANGNYWDYRVMYRRSGLDDPDFDSFELHEVYYENHKPVSCTENAIQVYCDGNESLKDTFDRMIKALDKPVLDYDNFPNEWIKNKFAETT
jgi:hypothetical protein